MNWKRTKKKAEVAEELVEVVKKEVEAEKKEARAAEELADAAEIRVKNIEDQLSFIKEGKDKTEADIRGKLVEFSSVDLEAFEDGFKRALSQFVILHPSVDCSIFDMDKDVKDEKLVEDDD